MVAKWLAAVLVGRWKCYRAQIGHDLQLRSADELVRLFSSILLKWDLCMRVQPVGRELGARKSLRHDPSPFAAGGEGGSPLYSTILEVLPDIC